MTYEEYAAADTDTLVTIEAYAQAKQAWIESNKDMGGVSTVTIYAQDRDGGYFLYNVPCSESDYNKLKEGTKIRYTGYKSEWAGEVETVADSIDPVEVVRGDIYISKAADVTDALGDEDELATYMNQRVAFKGMTIEPANADESAEAAETVETAAETEDEKLGKVASIIKAKSGKTAADETEAAPASDAPAYKYGWDGSGSEGDDLYFNASVDGKTYTFVIESTLRDKDSDVYKAVKELKVGDKVDMEGFMYWYEGPQPHIILVSPVEAEE